MAQEERAVLCCTTLGAVCFWVAAFLILYGLGLLLMQVWPGLESYAAAVLVGAMGLACLANVAWNRTFHCAITGPVFLLLAGLLALRTAGVWDVRIPALWPLVLIVVGVALLLERRYAR